MSGVSATWVIDRPATGAFAALSGDANPLHLDPVLARRSVYGRCAVHGIHLLLRALESCRREGEADLQSIVDLRARFFRPAFHDTPLIAECSGDGALDEVRILDESGALLAAVTVVLEPAPRADEEVAAGRPKIGFARPMRPPEAKGFAEEIPLMLDRALTDQLFPRALGRFRTVQIAELLAATRVIGMECPGLYSTLTAIQLGKADLAKRPASVASFRAVHLHAPTGRTRIAMEGPTLAGEIEAFFRPREVAQPSFEEVFASVGEPNMKERRVLVVGGSRGLGELAAKVFAARGARVVISYRLGEADAEKVRAEIVAGGGLCEAIRLDVGTPSASWRLPEGFVPTDLLYFATPHIGAPGASFEAARFRAFSAVYVEGLVSVVEFLSRQGAAPLRVFYPSTEFIDSGDGAAEYVAAKVAGESVARWLGTRPGVVVHCVRLPALATDETATFLGRTYQESLPTLLDAFDEAGDAQ